MRPSQIMRSGGEAPVGKYGKYMGWWGSLGSLDSKDNEPHETMEGHWADIHNSTGSPPQKGIASYSLSSNRQRPLAGTLNAAIFNTWRRFSHQVFYFAPPFIIAYFALDWAIERNHYLNSKAGRLAEGGAE
ncbi:hypothetical protein B7494_g3630 [Chlorociboria aeruginascens]|nr:hypothetical protein B7494_g3630 [Chlorociboria aeruginascens]